MTTHAAIRLVVLSLVALTASAGWADPFMGQYAGTFYPDSVTQMPATAVVVAEGEDHYRIRIEATSNDPQRATTMVEVYASKSGFEALIGSRSGGYHWHGQIKDGHLSVASEYGLHFELDKVTRKSPNEGLQPPAGAVVLLPYKQGTRPDLDAWTNQEWKALDRGAMQVGKGSTTTKERFGDIQHLHLEFWLPLEPLNRGQSRCNSGVFLNDLYEVQILDSFGLVETSGDCGSLYSVKRPDVNALLPPETWQTYDIEFHAARLGADGKVSEEARITVYLNGVKIHDNVAIPRPTANPNADQKPTGPIQLQDHGHPIQFRNIWLVKG